MPSCGRGEDQARFAAGKDGFDDILGEVLTTTDVTTVMIPLRIITLPSPHPRRPAQALPDRAENSAFLGQFTNLAEDVVFAVEYSVHRPCTPSAACSA